MNHEHRPHYFHFLFHRQFPISYLHQRHTHCPLPAKLLASFSTVERELSGGISDKAFDDNKDTVVTMPELTLQKKQRKSLTLILEFALGSTAASSIPTPAFEVSKQIILAAADVTLCWSIYALYYDEDLSVENIVELLKRAGIITSVGTVLVYTGARTTQGLADEMLNLTGIGTIVSGVIAGSSTALVGLAFLAWINNAWQQDQLLLEPIPEALPRN